jgi:hypothetical protein
LQRKGLAEGEFELLETDTTDAKGDENVGLQGYVTVTRLSTQIAREYSLGFETGWVQHFRQDLEAGVSHSPADDCELERRILLQASISRCLSAGSKLRLPPTPMRVSRKGKKGRVIMGHGLRS